jgi:hypothetical protein
VTALAVEPEFAEAVKLTELQICKMFRVPPHMVIGGTLTPNRVRAMENAWERHHIGIPSHPAYYVKFNTSALLRGDAQPHQA